MARRSSLAPAVILRVVLDSAGRRWRFRVASCRDGWRVSYRSVASPWRPVAHLAGSWPDSAAALAAVERVVARWR